MQHYMIIGWVFVTILYILMHHGYNWIARATAEETSSDDKVLLQFIFGMIYILLNVGYFVFTYGVFNNWK